MDFDGGFMRGAIAGDSTWNDGNDPRRKTIIRLGQLTPSFVSMTEKMCNGTSNDYPTTVTVKAGATSASVGGTVSTANSGTACLGLHTSAKAMTATAAA